MNITLIIVFLILILFCLRGCHRGMTKEISGLIAWAVTLFVISLIIMLYSSLKTSETRNTIYSIIILVLIGFIYGVVRFILKSAKFISKLPVFHLLDQLLGVAVGLGEGILIIWLLYVLNGAGLFGSFGSIIYQDTANSVILSLLYEYNYLAKVIAAL
ncbi:MAG: CvpA family protein [Lachnospiraceae bacterium]|nr:CvpA family protein [Lachnospiraceae bacterium]MDD7027262.1 CvpA family protein [Lachnospiraceae bacterium]